MSSNNNARRRSNYSGHENLSIQVPQHHLHYSSNYAIYDSTHHQQQQPQYIGYSNQPSVGGAPNGLPMNNSGAPLRLYSNQYLGSPMQPNNQPVYYHPHSHHPVQVQMVPPSPITPFDVQYGKSMLPKNLLVSSPFIHSNGSQPEFFPQMDASNYASSNSSLNTDQSNKSGKRSFSKNLNSKLKKINSSTSNNNVNNNGDSDNNNVSSSGNVTNNSNSISSGSGSDLENEEDDDEGKEDESLLLSPDNSYDDIELSPSPTLKNHSTKSTPLMEQSRTNDSFISTRTLLFLNLRDDIKLNTFLDAINFGPIENCYLDSMTNNELSTVEEEDEEKADDKETEDRDLEGNNKVIYPSKSVTVSFTNSIIADKCYKHSFRYLSTLSEALRSPNLIIKPTKSAKLLPIIKNAIENEGASRVAFIKYEPLLQSNNNNLNVKKIQKILVNEFEKFGTIESIKLLPNYNSAFMYFTSIASAMKSVEQLPISDSMLSNCFVFYGKDRNIITSTSQRQQPLSNESSSSTKDTFLPYDAPEIELQNSRSSSNSNQIDIYSTPSTSFSSPKISNSFVNLSQIPNNGNSYNNLRNLPTFYSNSRSSSVVDLGYLNTGAVNNQMNDSNDYYDTYKEFGYPQPVYHQMPPSSPYPNNYYSPNSPQSTNFNNVNNRTVYLGNLPSNTTIEDICNNIRGGILDSINLLIDKHICFVTFISSSDAADFYLRSNVSAQNPLIINGKHIKVSWGKRSPNLSSEVDREVSQNGASRNLYIGIVEEDEDDHHNDDSEDDEEEDDEEKKKVEKKSTATAATDENSRSNSESTLMIPDIETLRRDFSSFGEIEQINYFKDGQCAFVNFINIRSAITVVNEAHGENAEDFHKSFDNKYAEFKINYGKDRCGNPPKSRKTRKNKNRKRREKMKLKRMSEFKDGQSELDDSNGNPGFVQAFESIGITSKRFAELKINTNDHENEDVADSATVVEDSNNTYDNDNGNGEHEHSDDDVSSEDEDDIEIITLKQNVTPDHLVNGTISPSKLNEEIKDEANGSEAALLSLNGKETSNSNGNGAFGKVKLNPEQQSKANAKFRSNSNGNSNKGINSNAGLSNSRRGSIKNFARSSSSTSLGYRSQHGMSSVIPQMLVYPQHYQQHYFPPGSVQPPFAQMNQPGLQQPTLSPSYSSEYMYQYALPLQASPINQSFMLNNNPRSNSISRGPVNNKNQNRFEASSYLASEQTAYPYHPQQLQDQHLDQQRLHRNSKGSLASSSSSTNSISMLRSGSRSESESPSGSDRLYPQRSKPTGNAEKSSDPVDDVAAVDGDDEGENDNNAEDDDEVLGAASAAPPPSSGTITEEDTSNDDEPIHMVSSTSNEPKPTVNEFNVSYINKNYYTDSYRQPIRRQSKGNLKYQQHQMYNGQSRQSIVYYPPPELQGMYGHYPQAPQFSHSQMLQSSSPHGSNNPNDPSYYQEFAAYQQNGNMNGEAYDQSIPPPSQQQQQMNGFASYDYDGMTQEERYSMGYYTQGAVPGPGFNINNGHRLNKSNSSISLNSNKGRNRSTRMSNGSVKR